MDIIAAYHQTGSYRGAADLCGTTHKTVRRVIDRAALLAAGEQLPPRTPRPRNYDQITDLVAERIKNSKGKISAKRLLPVATAAGYTGSARNFRRLVADQRQAWLSTNRRDSRRPAVWEPGEYLVIDWAGTVGNLHLFCAVLAWSRFRFVAFAADEKATTTMALIAQAFTAIGGAPAKVLADRMGCLKGGVVANVVVPTTAYVEFASHYGFSPDFCHAADPASKGIVENLVGYAQRDLLIPLQTEAAVSGNVLTVAEANRAAVEWMDEVNHAVHSEIVAVPADRVQVEQALLKGLPSMELLLGPDPVTRTVDRLSCVRFNSARYSVPNRFIGQLVWVIPAGITAGDGLDIVDPSTGEVVADHVLVGPGEMSITDAHYGGPRKPPSRNPRPRTDAEQRFCALGPVAGEFIVGAAAAGNTRLGSELEVLLALAAAHGQEVFLQALGRAVNFRRFRAEDVRSILASGERAPNPALAGDALVMPFPTSLPSAPTRTLDAYRTQNYACGQHAPAGADLEDAQFQEVPFDNVAITVEVEEI